MKITVLNDTNVVYNGPSIEDATDYLDECDSISTIVIENPEGEIELECSGLLVRVCSALSDTPYTIKVNGYNMTLDLIGDCTVKTGLETNRSVILLNYDDVVETKTMSPNSTYRLNMDNTTITQVIDETNKGKSDFESN